MRETLCVSPIRLSYTGTSELPFGYSESRRRRVLPRSKGRPNRTLSHDLGHLRNSRIRLHAKVLFPFRHDIRLNIHPCEYFFALRILDLNKDRRIGGFRHTPVAP
jgi:hypothetical protein